MLEDHLESVTLEWLEGIGYTCLTGEDVSLGGSEEARSKYTEVVLCPRLETAIARLNPGIPAAAQAAAVSRLPTMPTNPLRTATARSTAGFVVALKSR
mgnify:CR=1 FL=1